MPSKGSTSRCSYTCGNSESKGGDRKMKAAVTGWSITARLGLRVKWLRGTRFCMKR